MLQEAVLCGNDAGRIRTDELGMGTANGMDLLRSRLWLPVHLLLADADCGVQGVLLAAAQTELPLY